MTETVGIKRYNATYIQVICSQGVAQELSDRFSFMADNARFDKRVKRKLWDGLIRLYDKRTNTILAGLKQLVIDYCESLGYDVIDGTAPLKPVDVSDDTFAKFYKAINLPEYLPNGRKLEVRDYQEQGVKIAATERRCLLKAATNAGKTIIAYLIYRWFNKKTLIIVPTTTLVQQSAQDFRDYGYDQPIAEITAGVSKHNLPQLTVATWHSLYAMPAEWMSQFEVIIGDEAHQFNAKAKAITGILEKSQAEIRIGMSGSLDDAKLNMLTYQGLFGKIHTLITNREMIDRGFSAKLTINVLVLVHPEEHRKQFAKLKPAYPTELDFILDSEKRHKFVCGLTERLSGNKLTLFRYTDYGKRIFETVKSRNPNTHYVDGEVDTDIRNKVRSILEAAPQNDVVASYKTFATGISITRLNHLILAHPTKAKTTITQAIGRTLRKSEEKLHATMWDIVDDLTWKSFQNHSYKHYLERLELYEREQLEYKITTINL